MWLDADDVGIMRVACATHSARSTHVWMSAEYMSGMLSVCRVGVPVVVVSMLRWYV